MSEQVQYITLDWQTYRRLENILRLDKECLVGLSQEELEALAESKRAHVFTGSTSPC